MADRRNISDTFGSYDKINQPKNIDSRSWEPISTGSSPISGKSVSSVKSEKPASKTLQKNVTKPKGDKAKGAAKKQVSSRPISQGRPEGKKKPPKKKASSKKAVSQSIPKSRTPQGRDMRSEDRAEKKAQQYSQSLSRQKENYRSEKQSGKSHDEISRNRAKKKRRRIKWGSVLTLAAVVLFTVFVIAFFCYSRGALVENIVVSGQSNYTDGQITAAAEITKGVNMLSIRERNVRKLVTKRLPYIKDVKVGFDFPDTVYITVEKTEDKYLITSDGTCLSVDTDGKVVSDKKTKPKDGIYQIDGFYYQEAEEGDTYKPEGENAKRFELMKQMFALIEKEGTVKTAVLNFKDINNVYMVYDGRIAVYFGKCEDMENRVPNACKIIERVKQESGKAYIDMRFGTQGYYKKGSMTIV